MSTVQMRSAPHRVRRVLRDMWTGMSDGDLLEAFITRRDEAPFEALLQRHGPMVWGVCCRFLHNQQDAEDAFQAVFLVFLRKAATIRPRERVGNWLYGVARRTALDARAMVAKRNQRECHPPEMPEPELQAAASPANDELGVLDRELCRLPEKYRSVIVLCELEGLTLKLAARQLAVPEGTVAGWLARAKAMLAKRLSRRNIVLSSAALALLAGNAAHAAVPRPLMTSTVNIAGQYAKGQAALGIALPNAVALSNGVLKNMFVAKCKAMALTALSVVVILGACLILTESQIDSPVAWHDFRAQPVPVEDEFAPARFPVADRDVPAPVTDSEPMNQ